MATKKSQRIGIWIIAVIMLVGTLGSFLVMILANDNQQSDQARLTQLSSEYEKEVADYSKSLSDKYYETFNQYADVPAAFEAASVTELSTNDLVVGTGEEIKEGTSYNAYYIGWNPTGKVFDQSIDAGSLKAPIAGGNLIEGWNKGVIGMKLGGVREITIPSAQAYGEAGSGEDIPANTPIKFIVMAIEPTSQPMPSKELMDLYGQLQQ